MGLIRLLATQSPLFPLPPVEVSLVEPVMVVREAQGSVDVCVRVSGVLERGVQVAFTTLDGTATGMHMQYATYTL